MLARWRRRRVYALTESHRAALAHRDDDVAGVGFTGAFVSVFVKSDPYDNVNSPPPWPRWRTRETCASASWFKTGVVRSSRCDCQNGPTSAECRSG